MVQDYPEYKLTERIIDGKKTWGILLTTPAKIEYFIYTDTTELDTNEGVIQLRLSGDAEWQLPVSLPFEASFNPKIFLRSNAHTILHEATKWILYGEMPGHCKFRFPKALYI